MTDVLYDQAIESLRAQRARLESDLQEWSRRAAAGGDLPLHHSQVERLNSRISAALSASLHGTPVIGEGAPPFGGSIADLPGLRRAVGTIHLLWDFFRDKLAQRDTPAYSKHLAVADQFAWSCYEPFLMAAVGRLAVQDLKEPPLVFYSTDRAPFAQARTKALHPPGLDSKDLELVVEELHRLPVPVIGMPWTVANRVPDLVLIGHEAGHVIAEDLGLAAEAALVVAAVNLTGNAATARKRVWAAWTNEIFADIIGVLATGTAYVRGLAAELAGASNDVERATIDFDKPGHYPTPTLRIAFCGEVLKAVCVAAPMEWTSTYPGIVGDSSDFEQDIALVANELMEHAWAAINGQTLDKLLPWDSGHEHDAEKVANAALANTAAEVEFDVRIWVAAAMKATLKNSKKFDDLDLDKKFASFIIGRQSDAVRSGPLVMALDDSINNTAAALADPTSLLNAIDHEAGSEIADRLKLRPSTL